MSDSMEILVMTTFHGIREAVATMFAYITIDTHMALASQERPIHDEEDRNYEEEKRLKEDLAREVRELKTKHEQVLESIMQFV